MQAIVKSSPQATEVILEETEGMRVGRGLQNWISSPRPSLPCSEPPQTYIPLSPLGSEQSAIVCERPHAALLTFYR